jgi:hypothetical protein
MFLLVSNTCLNCQCLVSLTLELQDVQSCSTAFAPSIYKVVWHLSSSKRTLTSFNLIGPSSCYGYSSHRCYSNVQRWLRQNQGVSKENERMPLLTFQTHICDTNSGKALNATGGIMRFRYQQDGF